MNVSARFVILTVFILAMPVFCFLLDSLAAGLNEAILVQIEALRVLSSILCIAWVFYIIRYSRILGCICLTVGIAFFTLVLLSFFFTVTVDDVKPRYDARGQIIDAHDGCIQFFNGRFYLYGSAYGNTDGLTNNSFHVYSSRDLQKWDLEGELLKNRTNAIYYRPYVVFDPNTRKYVLWYNWYPDRTNWVGHTGVAIADTPVGPFTITNADVHLACTNTGDGSLFVDDDGDGYFIYTCIADRYTIRVEKLTTDFLHATGQTSLPLGKWVEAPVLFRRGNLYYALCSPCCPFCPEGSDVQVSTATSPLGPFQMGQEAHINRKDAVVQQVTNHMLIESAGYDQIVSAQQTWVAKIPTANGTMYLWMGDRWQSSPDGLKGHDFQYWWPLEFSEDGQILPLKNLPRFRIPLKPLAFP